MGVTHTRTSSKTKTPPPPYAGAMDASCKGWTKDSEAQKEEVAINNTSLHYTLRTRPVHHMAQCWWVARYLLRISESTSLLPDARNMGRV